MRCDAAEKDAADELLFAHNNSSIRVGDLHAIRAMIHRLHVSEFGKICAKPHDKAQEVITGSIPAVPTNGIVIPESPRRKDATATTYRMVQRKAKAR